VVACGTSVYITIIKRPNKRRKLVTSEYFSNDFDVSENNT
jgi:hypothetical protein